MSLSGKTMFISGASRGIGLEIAKRAAADGANIALVAKTAEPHPKLPGTVYTAAKEIEDVGGQALPIVGDIRDGDSVADAVAKTVEQFGGIDICVNNASAINLGSITEVPLKRFDLMNGIQVRGTYAVSQACIPHMKGRDNPHILTLSPPIRLESKWLKPTAYMMAKFGMTLCALGIAEELRDDGIASNTLWPRTLVATAAVQNLLGGDEAMGRARKPDVYADAAYVILNKPAREYTGNSVLCEDVLVESGVTDLSVYDCVPGADLGVDLWVEEPNPPGYTGPLEQRGLLGLRLGGLDELGPVVADAVDQPGHLADLDPVEVAVPAQQALVDGSVGVEPAVPVARADRQRHPVMDFRQWTGGVGGDDGAAQQRRGVLRSRP